MRIVDVKGKEVKRPGAVLTIRLNKEPTCQGFQEGDRILGAECAVIICKGRPWVLGTKTPATRIREFLAEMRGEKAA